MVSTTPEKITRRPLAGLEARVRKHAAERRVERVLKIIATAVGKKKLPTVSQIARDKHDPFKVLVSTIISLRTKDEVTMEASRRLFKIAPTAGALASTPVRRIERAIFPAGFYRNKARDLKAIARSLVEERGGVVPDEIEDLLRFKGVGRKTATLVVSLGYGKPAICVDTHVHRISNRMGLVATGTPEETEYALMEIVPKKYWIATNELMVRFGQQTCTPISPFCSTCAVRAACARVGVEQHR